MRIFRSKSEFILYSMLVILDFHVEIWRRGDILAGIGLAEWISGLGYASVQLRIRSDDVNT